MALIRGKAAAVENSLGWRCCWPNFAFGRRPWRFPERDGTQTRRGQRERTEKSQSEWERAEKLNCAWVAFNPSLNAVRVVNSHASLSICTRGTETRLCRCAACWCCRSARQGWRSEREEGRAKKESPSAATRVFLFSGTRRCSFESAPSCSVFFYFNSGFVAFHRVLFAWRCAAMLIWSAQVKVSVRFNYMVWENEETALNHSLDRCRSVSTGNQPDGDDKNRQSQGANNKMHSQH
jgi:hypothetical protein